MADAFAGREGSFTCWVGSPGALSCASGGLLEGMPIFSPSTAKRLFAVTGVAGFPEVDGGAVPRIGSIEEAGLENFQPVESDRELFTIVNRRLRVKRSGEAQTSPTG